MGIVIELALGKEAIRCEDGDAPPGNALHHVQQAQAILLLKCR
jgi:hypothetical protein